METILSEWQQHIREIQAAKTEANEIALEKREAKSYKTASEMTKDILDK